jgi:hypothetical protein
VLHYLAVSRYDQFISSECLISGVALQEKEKDMLMRNFILLIITTITCCACSQSSTIDYPQEAPLSPRNLDRSKTDEDSGPNQKNGGLMTPEDVYKKDAQKEKR